VPKIPPPKLKQRDPRYDSSWGRRSWKMRRSTLFSRCSYCWVNRAAETHHLHYRDLRGAIKGRERIWLDCVPLCLTCHDLAHHKRNWKSHLEPDRRRNYGLYKFDARLRFLWYKVITAPLKIILDIFR
jgi:5-methylcytosine-specific restriction endonuclease McrA